MALDIINRLNKKKSNPEQGRNDDINTNNVNLPFFKPPQPNENINLEDGLKNLKKDVYLQK